MHCTFPPGLARPLPAASAIACAVLAASLSALCLASAQAATAPASDLVYRSIETPYPAPGPFHTNATALLQFGTVASLDHGLQVGAATFSTGQIGSFQHQAGGITVSFGATGVQGMLTSSANLFAKVQAGVDPIAFTDVPTSFRYVHVASYGSSQDTTLLTLSFSQPVQDFAFLGAGISDDAGTNLGNGPSQRIQLDSRPMMDVVGVPTSTIANPLQLSFGVIAAQPFSQVRLVLPAGSANDNAALANLSIAYAPTAPVPEPAGWALLIAGLAAVGRLAQRRSAA